MINCRSLPSLSYAIKMIIVIVIQLSISFQSEIVRLVQLSIDLYKLDIWDAKLFDHIVKALSSSIHQIGTY